MKTIKWILPVLSIALVWSCKIKNQEDNERNLTKIEINIDNFPDDFIVACCDNQFDTIKKNDDNKFEYLVLLNSDSYIDLEIGKNRVLLYVKPESALSLEANYEDFLNTLSFGGENLEFNNYLLKQAKLSRESEFNSEKFIYAKNYEIFSSAFREFDKKFKANLNEFTENNSKEESFVLIELERQKLINTLLILSYYYPLMHTSFPNQEIELELENLINSTDKNDPKLLNLSLFYNYAENLLFYKIGLKLRNQDIENISDEEYIKVYFDLIDEVFSEKNVIEAVYYSGIKTFLTYYGPELIQEQFKKYQEFSSNRQRLSELASVFAEYDKLSAGNPSVNWEFPDKNGKIHSLESFKGSFVYIDVWATWCGPCIRESPFFKDLARKYKFQNIVFISISLDESKNDWLNNLKDEDENIIHLWAGGWENPLCKFFKINAIPRFLLIDTKGNIINSNADRPSGDIDLVLKSLKLESK